jgi:hypothetical protein
LAYIKNSLVFSVEEGNEAFGRITKLYKEKIIKLNRNAEINDFNELKKFVDSVEEILKSSIPEEKNLSSWDFKDYVTHDYELLNRIKSYRAFPKDIIEGFMNDYLVSRAKAEDYFLEYLKFIYVCICTNEDQTPSIEVDMMWHFHHEHIENYVRFSNQALKLRVFIHDTGDNSPRANDYY